MHEDYLTLRLPRDLARALARWAQERGLAKSGVVREAVARYLAAPASPETTTRALTAAELAARWAGLPRLDAAEADAFLRDIAAARAALPDPRPPWA